LELAGMGGYEDIAAVFEYCIKKGILPGITSGDGHIPDWARSSPATPANTSTPALASAATEKEALPEVIDLTSSPAP